MKRKVKEKRGKGGRQERPRSSRRKGAWGTKANDRASRRRPVHVSYAPRFVYTSGGQVSRVYPTPPPCQGYRDTTKLGGRVTP